MSAFLAPVTLTNRETRRNFTTCRSHRVSVSKRSLFIATPLRTTPITTSHFTTRRLSFTPQANATSTSSAPKILIVGAPASGKGTQCKLIADSYGVVHVSTGDMLRSAVSRETELGKTAKQYMDSGKLVPDDLVIKMLVERVQSADCVERGWLLDGFPRTAPQAEALKSSGILPDIVISLEVPEDVLIQRVVGRRLDPETGNIYHIDFNPPPSGEIEKRCIQRSDDTKEKAKIRIDTFKTHAKEVQEKFADLLVSVDGNRDKDTVFNDVKLQIDSVLTVSKDDGDDALAVESKASNTGEKENSVGESATTAAAAAAAATAAMNSSTATDKEVEEIGVSEMRDSKSTLNMPVSEFVKQAEAAYEMGQLQTENVEWSGQAGLEKRRVSTSDWEDVLDRFGLAIGDTMAFILFAYIGRANHGDATFGIDTMKTALPFIAGWFLIAPLTGAYMRNSTDNVSRVLLTTLPGWLISVPISLGVRSVFTHHSPPLPFVIVSFVATAVILCGWRIGYVTLLGTVNRNGDKQGNFIDGFKMVTTLLRRW